MKQQNDQLPANAQAEKKAHKAQSAVAQPTLAKRISKSQIRSNDKVLQFKSTLVKALDVPEQKEKVSKNNHKEINSDIANQDKIVPPNSKISERIKEYKKRFFEQQKSIISSFKHLEKVQKSKVSSVSQLKIKKSSIQKVPCAFCDKLITFEEMQSHHSSCKMAYTCVKCHDIFPLFLKEEHQSVCENQSKLKDKKQPSYLKYYQKNRNEESDEDQELQWAQFMSLYPEIDPQLLRQHFEAQKQNRKYENSYKHRAQYNQPQYPDSSDEQQEDYQNGQPGAQYDNNDYEESESSKIVKGLKDYQIEDLITDCYHKGSNKQDDQCNICAKQKEEGQIIIRLPCFHTFHKQCLVPWLQFKSICPNCKYNLKQQ